MLLPEVVNGYTVVQLYSPCRPATREQHAVWLGSPCSTCRLPKCRHAAYRHLLVNRAEVDQD
jgi:hypothetical protein